MYRVAYDSGSRSVSINRAGPAVADRMALQDISILVQSYSQLHSVFARLLVNFHRYISLISLCHVIICL